MELTVTTFEVEAVLTGVGSADVPVIAALWYGFRSKVSWICADFWCLVLRRLIWRTEYLILDIIDTTEKVVRASEVRRHPVLP